MVGSLVLIVNDRLGYWKLLHDNFVCYDMHVGKSTTTYTKYPNYTIIVL